MPSNLEKQVEILTSRIKHYLISTMGRLLSEATSSEIYRALSYALKEEMMISWMTSKRTFHKFEARRLYYLSMEYLPGRILGNAVSNLHANPLVAGVAKNLNLDIRDLISCERDPGLGNGGLGRLASCFLDSLATQHLPAMGYGLRYHYGMFEQEIWNGIQIERPDCWLINENPWERRQDPHRRTVKFGGLMDHQAGDNGEEKLHIHEYDEVRALPFDIPILGYSATQRPSVVTLRLWSTKESPRNFQLQRYNAGRLDQAAENTALTDVLYPVDEHDIGRRVRVKQEFLLVSATLQDILEDYCLHHSNFDAFADKVRIQINDTHPALVIVELIRLLTHRHGIGWGEANEICRTCCSYTNHTILSEALEQWERNLIQCLLPRQYHIMERMNADFLKEVRQRFPDDEEKVRRMSILENGKAHMAHLAIYGSHKVNGVAELHTKILKTEIFKDFVELYPDRFIAITNGVTQRHWLLNCNPQLSQFISERIGDGWIKDFSQIAKLATFAGEQKSQEEFLAIKQANKRALIACLAKHHVIRDARGIPHHDKAIDLDCAAIFDVQIKRLHEYKRQLMNALHLIILYQQLKANPESHAIKRVAIIAGKAAPSYVTAKNVIQLIHAIARTVNGDPDIQDKLKLVFVENYNVSAAEHIIPAADLSEQISTAGMEASGTGNMKLAINGALTIGTCDGANIEMQEAIKDPWWPFTFGLNSDEIRELKQGSTYSPWGIYSAHTEIRQALDALRDRSLAKNDHEHSIFSELYYQILEGSDGKPPDPHFIIADLQSYMETQQRVEELYQKPSLWAETALHNIAGMGSFSADVSIKRYAEEIWGLKEQRLDPEVLRDVQRAYCEHDRFCVWEEH